MAFPPVVRIFSDPKELFPAAAQEFACKALEAVKARGLFSVALSGGSTPKALYGLLASDSSSSIGSSSSIPWDRVCFFWGDERHVPPDHPESNYRMAYETMLSKVPAKPENIYRIHSENPDASAAAAEYEQTLRRFFHLADRGVPRFDLILLGMGPDGHVASLFPGTKALQERSRLVVANWVDKFNTDRITLTLPVLNHAANVMLLVSGKDKASALASVFDDKSDPEQFPAKMVQPSHGQVTWLLDRQAASNLPRQ